MGRDGGSPGIPSSRRGGQGCRLDHLYCNSGARFESLFLFRFVTHQVHLTFSAVSSFVFHLSAFTCTYSYSPLPHLCFTLRLRPSPCTVCLSCSSTTEFPFYALVKYFPWFYVLLFVRILLSGFSSCQRHFLALRYILRIVSFITGISDFSTIFSIASFLCLRMS